jgi:hypothetical protein
MVDDFGVAFGIGKLYEGSTISYRRRKVNDEIWLPAEMRFSGSGRVVFRKFHIDSVIQYSDYRKFSVETETTFALPKKP